MVTKIERWTTPSLAQSDEFEAYGQKLLEINGHSLIPLHYAAIDFADIDFAAIDFPPAFPRKVQLGTVRDGRLYVRSPIKVKLSQEKQQAIAEAVEFNEFGFGENISEALIDLQRAIVELYFTMEKEQACLGSDLQKVWTKLQEKLQEKTPTQ